jgi:hypothetical protein
LGYFLKIRVKFWDNCTVADAGRHEQLEAARIVTGLAAYASLPSVYTETG